MNASTRNILSRLLAIMAIVAMLPAGVGQARAQAPEPPPPATPFDANFDPAAKGEPGVGTLSPPVGGAFEAGGQRLADMQYTDGAWGWPLTAPPTYGNTLGPIGMGLGKAFEHVGSSAMHDALASAGAYLLTKTNNFSPSDGYLAAELDGILGGNTYRLHVNTYFYGPLAGGTYDRNGEGTLYNTAGYVNMIRTNRASWDCDPVNLPGLTQANLAAWDIGMGLVGAAMAGADPTAWIDGTKAEINELNGDDCYDVIGLAGALYGLAFVGEDFDPTAGEHAIASNLGGLGTILVGYQLSTGGWTWSSNYQNEGEDNETIQETAYSILALNRLNRDIFLPSIIKGADYLYDVQLGTGGWADYAGASENNEITGEALWGLDAGYPVGDVWVCPSGDCGHPEAYYNTIQDGVDNVNLGGTVHVLPGTYVEQVIIDRPLQLYAQDDDPAVTIIQSPDTLTACWSSNKKPIICVENTDASVLGFTVDGAGKGNANVSFIGIGYHNASGTVQGNVIKDVRDNPMDGFGYGVGMYALNEDKVARTIVVQDNVIYGYGKNGMALSGDDLNVSVMNNTVTGYGATTLLAQNGIQVSYGATGTLFGNKIYNNVWTGTYGGSNDPMTDPEADGASGILLYMPGASVDIDHNTLTGNQFGLWSVAATNLDIHSNVVTGLAHTGSAFPTGIAIWSNDMWTGYFGGGEVGTTAAVYDNTLTGNDYGLMIRDYDVAAPAPSATATGNAFSNNHIQVGSSDGTINIPTTLATNTFDKAVTDEGSWLPFIWSHIQDGIDAASPGYTVHVNPGTYAERVVIDKYLDLVGAGVTKSIIDATSFTTAGNVIDITALTGDTKIEGFDILTGDFSNGIHSSGGTDPAGMIEIKNNHIISTNYGDDQFGIIAGYMDVRKLSISGNEISNTYSNSILVELQMGVTEITGNTLNGAFPSIFFMTYDGHDVTTLQKVHNNVIVMGGGDADTGVAGVGVNPSTYYVDTTRRTGKYSEFEISDNTFTGLLDASYKAISVGENSLDGTSGGFDDLNIFGNTISGASGKGIQLFGHITNADIYNNVITGLYQGLKGFSYESSYWPENNDISCNQITGASDHLVYWTGAGTFNVEDNWWGSELGPNPALMSANVDYTPWDADGTCKTFLPPYPTTTTITSDSPDPSQGDTVTIEFNVANNIIGGPVPTGTVTVDDGTNDICIDVPLNGSGEGSCTHAFTAKGIYTITATFTPSDVANFNSSSDTESHEVIDVTISGNVDVDGATLFYLNGGPRIVVANGAGDYSFVVPIGWSGVVTPSKDGHTFSAVHLTYTNVLVNQTAQDYTPKSAALFSRADFDADHVSDIGYFHAASGLWGILDSSLAFSYSSPTFHTWGQTGDLVAPGDYDGDGYVDPTVRRPPAGGQSAAYLMLLSSTGYDFGLIKVVPAGWPGLGDTPVPADYNGDGITDPAIWRGNTGVWIIPMSPTHTTYQFYSWGASGDKPFGADVDGDGKADIGYWRPSTGMWAFLLSSYSYSYASPAYFTWGVSADTPVMADYDGDNKADPAFVTPPAGAESAGYSILKSTTGYDTGLTETIPAGWPGLGDTPVPADYDGDGLVDGGIWRSSSGVWIIPMSSTNNTSFIFASWGASGDQLAR